MANRPPFYIQITNVKENFINDAGSTTSMDLPLVTLPAGTVLFRAMKIPEANEDIRYFYRDYLGNPEKDGKVCLSPVQNVFFYPFPYVALGANNVGKTFTMMQMVVLVHPINVVCGVSPSTFVRGQGLRYSGTAPLQRCNKFGADTDCHTPDARELDARRYDNCLNPDYQLRSGTRGTLMIADLDSLNPSKGVESTMSRFLQWMETQIPGEGAKALAWAYIENNRIIGYPEITIYPYHEHKGRKLITRTCTNNEMAMRLIEKEAANDNLNYLPLAAFTKNGVIDMVNGDFSYDSLVVTPNAFRPQQAQEAILPNMKNYMTRLQTEGIDLPYYGLSKLTLDTRTGFFVLNKVVTKMNLPIPRAILNAQPSKFSTVPYEFLLMPMDTEDARRRAMSYLLMFRNYLPEHYMEKYPIEKGFGVRRAMIFNHAPVLKPLFEKLGFAVPKTFLEPLDRASKMYRKETGIVRPTPLAPAPPAPPSPEYAPMTPPSPSYAPMTPPSTIGGKTRKNKKRSTTRKSKVHQYATLFRRIWKAHGNRV